MLTIPSELEAKFQECLRNQAIPKGIHGFYKKWLRYYLDFCDKHHFPAAQRESLPHFLRKLQEKRQTKAQQEQAVSAIGLFYEILGEKPPTQKLPPAQGTSPTKNAHLNDVKQLSVHEAFSKPWAPPSPSAHSLQPPRRNLRQERSGSAGPPTTADPVPRPRVTTRRRSVSTEGKKPAEARDATGSLPSHQTKSMRGASWQAEYTRLANEIQVRHYSPKTFKSYNGWLRKFQAFTRSKDPLLLSTDDVKEFLTFLAVKRKEPSSTQNQAFNAILFFSRHVLDKEFGKVDGVVRAKRKPYIPVVLSREEIDAILIHLSPPYDLVVRLLYGCGLRLFECLNLRVQCFNLDARVLTVHDGKGQKDRTVPIPEAILAELGAQLEFLKDLHRRDLDRGYDGVFLVNALEKKYKNAPKDFIWQWFFHYFIWVAQNRMLLNCL